MMGDVYIYIFGEVIKKDEGKLWHNFYEEDLLKASTKKVGYSWYEMRLKPQAIAAFIKNAAVAYSKTQLKVFYSHV